MRRLNSGTEIALFLDWDYSLINVVTMGTVRKPPMHTVAAYYSEFNSVYSAKVD